MKPSKSPLSKKGISPKEDRRKGEHIVPKGERNFSERTTKKAKSGTFGKSGCECA